MTLILLYALNQIFAIFSNKISIQGDEDFIGGPKGFFLEPIPLGAKATKLDYSRSKCDCSS